MPVNCYDAKTRKLITTYASVNDTIRSLAAKGEHIIAAIKSNKPYKGRIYAYKGVDIKARPSR